MVQFDKIVNISDPFKALNGGYSNMKRIFLEYHYGTDLLIQEMHRKRVDIPQDKEEG